MLSFTLRKIFTSKAAFKQKMFSLNLLHKTVLKFFINKLKLITLLFPFRNVWYFVK